MFGPEFGAAHKLGTAASADLVGNVLGELLIPDAVRQAASAILIDPSIEGSPRQRVKMLRDAFGHLPSVGWPRLAAWKSEFQALGAVPYMWQRGTALSEMLVILEHYISMMMCTERNLMEAQKFPGAPEFSFAMDESGDAVERVIEKVWLTGRQTPPHWYDAPPLFPGHRAVLRRVFQPRVNRAVFYPLRHCWYVRVPR